MKWSAYQEAVFDFAENGTGNGIVEATAGSGKSTVIEEVARRLTGRVLICSFTTMIEKSMIERVKAAGGIGSGHEFRLGQADLTIKSLNKVGWHAYKASVPGRKRIDGDKVKKLLRYEVLRVNEDYSREKWGVFCKMQPYVTRLVGLGKAYLCTDGDQVVGRAEEWCETLGIERPEIDWDGLSPAEALRETFNLSLADRARLDFDDQIYYPAIDDTITMPEYDWVLVDEFQDTTLAQIRMLQRCAHSDTRFLVVGDTRQSIYAFRGATSDAMTMGQREFEAVRLPLSISYRCSKAVVEEARNWLDRMNVEPDIEPFDGAIDGKVKHVDFSHFHEHAKPGDLGMCRTTAPLIKECLWFLRHNRPAQVLGREIGTELKAFILGLPGVNKLSDTRHLQASLEVKLREQSERNNRLGRETAQMILEDRAAAVNWLMSECDTVEEICNKIEQIFDKDARNGYITLLTGHKAKGLEADRTWILHPDQIPHKRATSPEAIVQEINLGFVMITRAKDTLHWVREDDD